MKPEKPANWQVWQNKKVAQQFTENRRGGLLGSEAQMSVLLQLVGKVNSQSLEILDLGCGDGILTETVMRDYPVSRAVLVDGSPAMLEKAEARFETLGLFSSLIEFKEADFNLPEWRTVLPICQFDVIVSGFAIHHCEDERKRSLYAELTEMLKPGGLLVNIEHVASATPLGEEFFERAYAESVAKFRVSQGSKTNAEEVYQELLFRPDKEANRLAPVAEQLEWFTECGLRDVDCYWKQFELAVLAGYKG